jgi:hypothetical protein
MLKDRSGMVYVFTGDMSPEQLVDLVLKSSVVVRLNGRLPGRQ